jgi:hypothetical protein
VDKSVRKTLFHPKGISKKATFSTACGIINQLEGHRPEKNTPPACDKHDYDPRICHAEVVEKG